MVSGECSKAHPAFKIARPFAVPSVLIALLNVTGFGIYGLRNEAALFIEQLPDAARTVRREDHSGPRRSTDRTLSVGASVHQRDRVVVWIGFRLLRLREAGIWSVVAAVLFAVPYVEPTVVTLGAAVAGFVQFGSLAMAGAKAVCERIDDLSSYAELLKE